MNIELQISTPRSIFKRIAYKLLGIRHFSICFECPVSWHQMVIDSTLLGGVRIQNECSFNTEYNVVSQFLLETRANEEDFTSWYSSIAGLRHSTKGKLLFPLYLFGLIKKPSVRAGVYSNELVLIVINAFTRFKIRNIDSLTLEETKSLMNDIFAFSEQGRSLHG